MPKPLSPDLRKRILQAYDQGGVSQQEVADRFAVSRGSVKKLLKQRRLLGDISPQYQNCGAPPKITQTHREHLRLLLATQPDMTLEELKAALGVDCTVQAIHYALKDMGMSYKKRRSGPRSKDAKTLSGPAKNGNGTKGG